MKTINLKNKKKWFNILLVMFLIVVCLVIITHVGIGNDYYWHIKAGEYMVNHKVILKHDVFSWYATKLNLPWVAHEWLTEIILYKIYSIFNNYTATIFPMIMFFITMLTTIIVKNKEFHKNIIFSLFWLLASILLMAPFILPRPQMFSYLLFVITLYLLFDLQKNENSKKIYFLPIISIAWANLHGGSSNLPYILCFIFFFIGNFNFSKKKMEAKPNTPKQQRKFLLVMILCMLAVMINPNGYKLFLYPYQNMRDTTMTSSIMEWSVSDPSDISSIAIYFFLGYTLLQIFLSDKKLQLKDGILIAMFGFLAIKHVRFWPLSYLVTTFIIFDYIKEYKIQYKITVQILFIFIIALGCSCLPDENIDKNYKLIDDEFINIIKDKKPLHLCNDYNYGGYLIYNNIPVFIDGRCDLYSKYNYKDYLTFTRLTGEYKTLLEKYECDMFLYEKNRPIANYLKDQSDQYQLLLDKDNTVLYELKS